MYNTNFIHFQIMRALLNEDARKRPTAKDMLKIFEALEVEEW